MTAGVMHELNHEGDTKIVWDSEDADSVAVAQKAFDTAIKKGMLAYAAEGKKGERGAQVRTFTPEAERIILVRPMAGG